MASVDLTGVRKSFGDTVVIQGVDIAIADGEFAVFVGPSGCGKSTLLRMIAGLDHPDAGTISIGGRVVNDMPPKEREVAMVFQTYALYPHMTVRANMGFGLMIAGAETSAIAGKVAQAARMLGLDALLDRLPRQLSGGQRQRVAMGRAMVRDPQVFLFDEPLSNLDAKLRVQMRTEIRALHQRLGTTSIYVTHDQVEAMTMADRIVVLRDGKVEQIGSPLALYDQPCNTFVAGFIGSPAMNLVATSLDQASILQGFCSQISLPPQVAVAPQQKLTLGLRPEHLRVLAPDAPGLRCKVDVVEFTGADTVLSCSAADAGEQAPHSLQVLVHDRVPVRPGDALSLGIAPEKIHVFDHASGQRI